MIYRIFIRTWLLLQMKNAITSMIKKISYDAFSKLKADKRVQFLSCAKLEKLYEGTIKLQDMPSCMR